MEFQNVVLWILSTVGASLSLLVSFVAKMLWSTIRDIQRENERQTTRINALEVSMAKVESLSTAIAALQSMLEKHMSLHDHMAKEWEKDRQEAIRFRATYIPQIERANRKIDEILTKLESQ